MGRPAEPDELSKNYLLTSTTYTENVIIVEKFKLCTQFTNICERAMVYRFNVEDVNTHKKEWFILHYGDNVE